jgi:hypothetical protein
MEAFVITGAEWQSELIDHLNKLIRYLKEDRTPTEAFTHVTLAATNYLRILTK